MTSIRKVSTAWATIALCGLCSGLVNSYAQESSLTGSGNQARSLLLPETVTSKSRIIEVVGTSNESSKDVKRVALVVGNGNYEKITKLNNPINDASDVCDELKALQFDVICKQDVHSRREFRELVRVFISKLGLRTVAVFYYAGHGIQLNGENYLLPTSIDARSGADIEDDGLSLAYLLRSLEDARSSPNIVVLDACRNNPFSRHKIATAAKGLARVEPPIGTMLVYATSPNGVALDGDGRNGIFTKHFINKIREPGLKIDELFQVVSNNVQEDAKKFGIEQVPFRSSSYSGAYCLAGCENPQVLAELEKIRTQKEDAIKKINELSEENFNLKAQASAKGSVINDLESKILVLSQQSISGVQTASMRKEMAQLRVALSEARAELVNIERLKKAVDEREDRIIALKSQIHSLQNKADEIEKYRLQVRELQQQSGEATERMQLLSEENVRLKRISDKYNENITKLEASVDRYSVEANLAGISNSTAQAELSRLKASLEAARAQKQELEVHKTIAAEREKQIEILKNQITELDQKSKQLELSRQQIMVLQKENAEKSQLLNERGGARGGKPVLVPPIF